MAMSFFTLDVGELSEFSHFVNECNLLNCCMGFLNQKVKMKGCQNY